MSFLPVFLLLLFLLFLLNYHKRKKLILQIQRMPSEKKSALLQNLLLPYDLSYLPLHDLLPIERTRGSQKPAAVLLILPSAMFLFRMLF